MKTWMAAIGLAATLLVLAANGATPEESLDRAHAAIFGNVSPDRLRHIRFHGYEEATAAERRHIEQGVEHLRAAADAGDPDGQYWYAIFLCLVDSSKTARVECDRWHALAAEQGHVDANFMLGRRALSPASLTLDNRRRFVVSDESRLGFLQRAAELGHLEAIVLLENVQETDRQIGELEARAIAGDPEAQREWAWRFAGGAHDDRDEFIRWLKKAADQGDLVAARQLGKALLDRDLEAGRRYLTAAADSGDVEAVTSLGDVAACTGDLDVARRHFERAIELGDETAQYALADLEASGSANWHCPYVDTR